ncbi:MAG: type VI immunity family protein [Maricaulaceae bacterium]
MTVLTSETVARLSAAPLLMFEGSNDPALLAGLTMSFYFNRPDNAQRRQAILACIREYLDQAKGQLRYYAINLEKRNRTLKDGQTVDEVALAKLLDTDRTLEFEASGDVDGSASHPWSIAALAHNAPVRPSYLGYLWLTYPLSVSGSLDGFIKQFISFCDRLEVEHAYGGLGFIVPSSVGGMNAAAKIAGETAMRLPGFDLDHLTGVSIYCEHGIKCVNFLTAVSDHWLEKVGGGQAVLDQAGDLVSMYRYSKGYVFRAGAAPDTGEQGPPPAYVALGRALKPIRAPYPARLLSRPDLPDGEALTQDWLARFDGAP